MPDYLDMRKLFGIELRENISKIVRENFKGSKRKSNPRYRSGLLANQIYLDGYYVNGESHVLTYRFAIGEDYYIVTAGSTMPLDGSNIYALSRCLIKTDSGKHFGAAYARADVSRLEKPGELYDKCVDMIVEVIEKGKQLVRKSK